MNEQFKSTTGQCSKDNSGIPENQIVIQAESLVLAKMQGQTGLVKHIIGSPAEDAWSSTNDFKDV